MKLEVSVIFAVLRICPNQLMCASPPEKILTSRDVFKRAQMNPEGTRVEGQQACKVKTCLHRLLNSVLPLLLPSRFVTTRLEFKEHKCRYMKPQDHQASTRRLIRAVVVGNFRKTISNRPSFQRKERKSGLGKEKGPLGIFSNSPHCWLPVCGPA